MSLDTRGVQIPNGSKNPDDEQYVSQWVGHFQGAIPTISSEFDRDVDNHYYSMKEKFETISAILDE